MYLECLELSKNSTTLKHRKASIKSKIVNWHQTHLITRFKTVKHKSVRNFLYFHQHTTAEKEKKYRESLWKRLWPGEGFTESHLLVLGLLTCAGIPSPAAYRTVLASGWLQTNRQFWRLGLWSTVLLLKVASALPAFLSTSPQAHPTPHISQPCEAGASASQ